MLSGASNVECCMGGWHVRIQSRKYFCCCRLLLLLKGPESYLLLQTSLKDVWNAINIEIVVDNNCILSLVLI